MKLPNGNQTLQHIRSGAGVRLVKHAFVTCTGGAGFVGVYPGNNEYLILHLLLNRHQTGNVIQYALFPVR